MGGNVAGLLGHEDDHKGHDHEVGIERPHLVQDIGVLVIGRLDQGQPLFEGEFLYRVGRLAFLVRRAIDGNDVVAAIQHRFQAGLTEGLLAVDDYPHILFLLRIGAGGLNGPFFLCVLDFLIAQPDDVLENFLGVLPHQRRAFDIGR